MSPDALKALQHAAQLFAKGELAQVESICRKILLIYSEANDVLHLLALVRKQQGNAREAEELLNDCVRRQPRRADIRANLGNLLSSAGRFDEAEAAYRGALRNDAAFRPARLGLARLLLKSKRYERALEESGQLLAANSGDAEALIVAGTTLRELGRFGQAEWSLRQAITANPRSGVARHNLGSLLAHLSRSEEALNEFEYAASCGIAGAEIDFNLASTLIELNRFDEADSTLKHALNNSPRDARAHRLLAKLRFMRGNIGFAEELGAAVERFAQDSELRLTHAQVLRGGGLPDPALATLLAAPDQDDPRIQAELAAVHQETGRFEEACRAARAAVAASPQDPAFTDLLIDALLSAGLSQEAMPLIEEARRRDPLNQWYIALEATAARVLGDPRYELLYDYDKLVQTFELKPPPGWASIEAFHTDLIPVLRDRQRFNAHPLDQSLRLGTQTPRGLLGDPDRMVRAFIAALDAPITEYRKRVGYDPSHPFLARNRGATELKGCWSVRLRQGGFHVNHVHSEGWISSAYYVEVPDEVADSDARSGWLKFGESRFPIPGVYAAKFVQPVAGRLVLFPSYMWHGTTPLSGQQPRMTIAFDALPQVPAPGASR